MIEVVIETPRWSLAVGEWDGQRRLAARWNGDDDHPKGNPVSRGMPTWFMLPDEFIDPLLTADLIPSEKRNLAQAYLGVTAGERIDPGELPLHDLGPWPERLSLRRADIYSEDER